MTFNLDSETTAIENAAATYEANHAKLFTAPGQPVYSPETHAAKVAELQTNFNQAIEAKAAAADEKIATLQTELTLATAQTDPMASLTPDELAAANARREFVKEDVEAASWQELAHRLELILIRGDRAEIFLLSRYASTRVAAAGRIASQYQPFLREIHQRLNEARARLVPAQSAEKIEAIKRQIEDLQIFKVRARRRVEVLTVPRRERVRL
jgi:hypothetical protein